MCVSLMQNRMALFSTAAKLCVWRLRLRGHKAQSPHYWHLGGQNVKSLNHYNIWRLCWIVSSQMTKTFRDNCDINIVQQPSCEPLFPVVQMQLKTYFFVPSVRPGSALADAGPNARPRRGAPLSSDFMTSSCSVNRVTIVVERRYAVQH